MVHQNTAYISHLLRVPYADYPSTFQRVLVESGEQVELEVDEIRCVGWCEGGLGIECDPREGGAYVVMQNDLEKAKTQ